MWDYGGSHDDGDDKLPLEVLQANAADMLEGCSHNATDLGQSNALGSFFVEEPMRWNLNISLFVNRLIIYELNNEYD